MLFRVKSVPTFYLPYFRYPLKQDQRATGFLFPRFRLLGVFAVFAVGAGFFWATGRGHDQTFLLDYYSKFGTGLTHELRYLRLGGSGGRFRSNVVQRTDAPGRDFDLDWRGRGRTCPAASVRRSTCAASAAPRSSRSIRTIWTRASIRRQGGSLNIQGRLLGNNVQLVTELNETFFGDELTRSIRRLPALRISRSPKRIGRTGIVLRYEARARAALAGRPGPDGALQPLRYLPGDLAPDVDELPPGEPAAGVSLHALFRHPDG